VMTNALDRTSLVEDLLLKQFIIETNNLRNSNKANKVLQGIN